MTDEENEEYMAAIQDMLLDLQLDGKVKIEEITTTDEADGGTTTNIRIRPIINTEEEMEEFLRKVRACGYIEEKSSESEVSEDPS
jgi:hypothetical protein